MSIYRDTILDYFKTEQPLDIFKNNTVQDEQVYSTAILTTCIDVFDMAVKLIGEDLQKEPTEHKQLLLILDYGHKLWLEVIEHIRKTYQIELSQLGFIIGMRIIIDSDKEIMEEKYQNWMYAFRDILNRIAADMRDAYRNGVNEKKLADAVDQTNPELIKDFLKSCYDIEFFHRNDEKYYTDKKRELHNHIMELYQIILDKTDL